MKPTFEQAVGALALLLILSVLSFSALEQSNHDALVALISLVTGSGIGVVASKALHNPPGE